jgi:hypothetical protein
VSCPLVLFSLFYLQCALYERFFSLSPFSHSFELSLFISLVATLSPLVRPLFLVHQRRLEGARLSFSPLLLTVAHRLRKSKQFKQQFFNLFASLFATFSHRGRPAHSSRLSRKLNGKSCMERRQKEKCKQKERELPSSAPRDLKHRERMCKVDQNETHRTSRRSTGADSKSRRRELSSTSPTRASREQ